MISILTFSKSGRAGLSIVMLTASVLAHFKIA